jgi:hypothetical protein
MPKTPDPTTAASADQIAESKPGLSMTKKIIIGCAILAVACLILGGGGFLVFGKTALSKLQNAEQSTALEDKAKTDRVKGNAGALYPYGDVQEDKVASALFTHNEGGTLAADLANNVKVYVIAPPGSPDPDGNVYSLTPYFSMPTSQRAPALPTDLGYGVDFEVEGAHGDHIPATYVVFDLDQGKTVNEIAKDKKLSYFCLPTASTFNPAGCALLKGIPTSDHTNLKYGVVSPIRDVEHNDLMFMNTTIPIGYDNLIVTVVNTQATFIPIRLTKDVLTDVIRADKPGYTMPLTEAMVHAVNNDIFYDDPAVYYNLNKSISYADSPFDIYKSLSILPKYKTYLDKLKVEAPKHATQDILADTAVNYVDLQIGDYNLLESDLKSFLIKKLAESGSGSSGNAEETLTNIFHARRLENENFPNAKTTRIVMASDVLKDVNYYLTPSEPHDLNDYLMYESVIWANPESFPDGKMTAADNTSLIKKTFAEEPKPMTPEEQAEFIKKATEAAEAPLKDPCNFSMSQLNRAMKLAQQLGRSDIEAKLLEQILLKLISSLRDGTATLDEYALAQEWGLTDKYKCTDDLYQGQIAKNPQKLVCHTEMKKNLKNFGDNRVDCSTYLPPAVSGTPVVPKNCNLPDPPKCGGAGGQTAPAQ